MSKYREKYPWLRILNLYTGKITPNYDAMDDMPDGWAIAFGDLFCEEMDKAIKEAGLEDKFVFVQVKEKYGQLRIYTNGTTPDIDKIIRKYECISGHVCIHCGQPDTPMLNLPWISPLCKACYDETNVGMDAEYSKVADDEPNIPDEFTYGTYKDKEWTYYKEDIKENIDVNEIKEEKTKEIKNLNEKENTKNSKKKR